MKVVYVAGPYRGKTAWDIECNIRRAEEWGLIVAEIGASPLIPHSNTRFFHGLITDQFWLDATMALLRKSDAVLLIPGWRRSSGAQAEREEAIYLGIPVFEEIADLRHWLEQFRGAA